MCLWRCRKLDFSHTDTPNERKKIWFSEGKKGDFFSCLCTSKDWLKKKRVIWFDVLGWVWINCILSSGQNVVVWPPESDGWNHLRAERAIHTQAWGFWFQNFISCVNSKTYLTPSQRPCILAAWKYGNEEFILSSPNIAKYSYWRHFHIRKYSDTPLDVCNICLCKVCREKSSYQPK